MKTKKCTKCGIEKEFDCFHKDSKRKDGHRSQCKSCIAEYYQNNKEKIVEHQVKYNSRPEVKERKAKYDAEYYAKYNSRPEVKKRKAEYNAEYRAERNAEQPACVYQIVNTVNNKIYIGQTTQGELRWKRHITDLLGNYHDNHKLQADFNKFGEEVFTWSIIKEYPKNRKLLESKEEQLIEQYEKEGKQLYNITRRRTNESNDN
jgi:predicted GIY-YIG superfamily endonuclease